MRRETISGLADISSRFDNRAPLAPQSLGFLFEWAAARSVRISVTVEYSRARGESLQAELRCTSGFPQERVGMIQAPS
jgi:hypothetical protein